MKIVTQVKLEVEYDNVRVDRQYVANDRKNDFAQCKAELVQNLEDVGCASVEILKFKVKE